MTRGYFRFPAVFKNQVVFTSEDDLWEAPLDGGAARRLTAGRGSALIPVFLLMAGNWRSALPKKVTTRSMSCRRKAAISAG